MSSSLALWVTCADDTHEHTSCHCSLWLHPLPLVALYETLSTVSFWQRTTTHWSAPVVTTVNMLVQPAPSTPRLPCFMIGVWPSPIASLPTMAVM